MSQKQGRGGPILIQPIPNPCLFFIDEFFPDSRPGNNKGEVPCGALVRKIIHAVVSYYSYLLVIVYLQFLL